MLMALQALVAGPTLARSQSHRRAEQPPPDTSFDAEAARCAPAYAAALKTIFSGPTPQPLATALAVRKPLPGLTGRWLFHHDGDRRRQRDEAGRLVDGDKVCAEELSRGGRTRCQRWETRAPASEPVVPVPQPSREETRVLSAVAEFVANKGAPPEFLGNGRYTIMTERVATDLEAYARQGEHPAICSGADELVDFLTEKLAPLAKRMGDVEELRQRSLALVAPRVEALHTALAPIPGATAGVASPAATSVVATATDQPGLIAGASEVRPTSPAVAMTAPQPSTPAGWVGEVGRLILTPADAHAVASAPTPLTGLGQIADLLASGRSTAPAAARAEARAALRAIEAATYVDMLSQRYVDLRQALFGTLDAVRKAHAADCTCGG